LRFSWDPAPLGRKPNVFRHNLLRDFVCDSRAFRVLNDVAKNDIHVIGWGDLEGDDMVAVQVTSILDVIDEERSILSEYSWARISFPHISNEVDALTNNRIFRLPNRELSLLVLAGESAKSAIENAGITGWRYERAWVDE
jgi:hypothetical protein